MISKNNFYKDKAQKYKKKYIQLKILYGGILDTKTLNINYTSMISDDYYIKQNSQTINDTKSSHYESKQSFYVYSSIKDDIVTNKKQFITNIENNMKSNNINISIEENNFDMNEFIEYLKLACNYNYKVNITFPDNVESGMNELVKKLGEKVNEPIEWLKELKVILL